MNKQSLEQQEQFVFSSSELDMDFKVTLFKDLSDSPPPPPAKRSRMDKQTGNEGLIKFAPLKHLILNNNQGSLNDSENQLNVPLEAPANENAKPASYEQILQDRDRYRKERDFFRCEAAKQKKLKEQLKHDLMESNKKLFKAYADITQLDKDHKMSDTMVKYLSSALMMFRDEEKDAKVPKHLYTASIATQTVTETSDASTLVTQTEFAGQTSQLSDFVPFPIAQTKSETKNDDKKDKDTTIEDVVRTVNEEQDDDDGVRYVLNCEDYSDKAGQMVVLAEADDDENVSGFPNKNVYKMAKQNYLCVLDDHDEIIDCFVSRTANDTAKWGKMVDGKFIEDDKIKTNALASRAVIVGETHLSVKDGKRLLGLAAKVFRFRDGFGPKKFWGKAVAIVGSKMAEKKHCPNHAMTCKQRDGNNNSKA